MQDTKKTATIQEVKDHIRRLENPQIYNLEVRRCIADAFTKNKPEIERLNTHLKKLQEPAVKKKAPRWPADVPENVLSFCRAIFQGSTEYQQFRIHCWDGLHVIVSWPSGGYSDNGGWHPTPATFMKYRLSDKPGLSCTSIGKDRQGRQSKKQLQQWLEEPAK